MNKRSSRRLMLTEECDLTCYQTSGEVSSWYKAYSDVSYNLATPITDDSFKDYAFYKRDYRPLHDDREYWIGLRKEIYEWIGRLTCMMIE